MTGCRVEVCPDPFDPWQQLALWNGDYAAAVIFIGRVRPTTIDGRPLEALELEHFAGLCERQITAMAQRLQQEHQAGPILVLHRVGKLAPGAGRSSWSGAALLSRVVGASQAPGPVLEAGVVRWSGHLAEQQYCS